MNNSEAILVSMTPRRNAIFMLKMIILSCLLQYLEMTKNPIVWNEARLWLRRATLIIIFRKVYCIIMRLGGLLIVLVDAFYGGIL